MHTRTHTHTVAVESIDLQIPSSLEAQHVLFFALSQALSLLFTLEGIWAPVWCLKTRQVMSL